jgi:hypothetical protein
MPHKELCVFFFTDKNRCGIVGNKKDNKKITRENHTNERDFI